MNNYEQFSLETHLFFARIMREHALFLMAGIPPVNDRLVRQADDFREQFEDLLRQAVEMSRDRISERVLRSGELFTDFTGKAEKSTSELTGIPVDTGITLQERMLRAGSGNYGENRGLCRECSRKNDSLVRNRMDSIRALNRRALKLTDGLIAYKEMLLSQMKECRIFTFNYPLLIAHIIREAKLYRAFIQELEEKGTLLPQTMRSMEIFWNQIMMEHALFIRGLLDPSEEELIKTANGFAGDYKKLLQEAREQDQKAGERQLQYEDDLTRRTIRETIKYRDFKEAGTKGITDCMVSSLILPLLADHVLREANHYLRILDTGSRG